MRNLTDAEVAERLAKKAAAGQALADALDAYMKKPGHNVEAWSRVKAALDALRATEYELALTE